MVQISSFFGIIKIPAISRGFDRFVMGFMFCVFSWVFGVFLCLVACFLLCYNINPLRVKNICVIY